MSKISRMSYVDLGRMIDSAVGAGILDRSSDRSHLPDAFLFKMQALAERYREQQRHYQKLTAQAQIIRETRDKISPMLAQLVRNTHTSFTRFLKLDEVLRADMIEYQIPKQASQQPANRIKVWIQCATTITRVFHKQKEQGRLTLPPYILTEGTVNILAHHLAKAEAIQFKLERQLRENNEAHSHLVHLRRQVVQTLELVKRHLELSLYGKSKSTRKLALAAYGMLLPDGKGKSHMLGAHMNPDAPIQRQKAPDPPPDPAPPQQKQTAPETTAPQTDQEPAEKSATPAEITDTALKAAITIEETAQPKTNNWDKVRAAAKKRKAAMAQNPKQRKKRPGKSKKHR